MIEFPSNPTDGQIVTQGSKTWKWIASKGVWDLTSTPDEAASTAIAASTAALSAKALAEAARDASFSTANVGTNLATQRATVVDGQQFTVVTTTEAIRYRRDSSTTQTELARYPLSQYVRNLIEEVSPEVIPGAVSLLAGHAQGLSIDTTDDNLEYAVKVVDTTTPANNFAGSVLDFLPRSSITFTTPKLCLQADGTYKWQSHNNALQSEDFNTTWTRTSVTAVAGALGPDGSTANATTLTTSSTTNTSVSQNISVLANRYYTHEFYVKKGTAAFCYIAVTNNSVTRRAYFDLTNGAFVTVEAGLTASVSTTFPDGTPLAAGWFRIRAYHRSASTNDTMRLGVCDADSNVAVTIGVTLVATQAHHYGGVRSIDYIKTTTTTRRGIPYDWTPGVRSLRLDIATNYRGRQANDLTNPVWVASNIGTSLNAVGPDGEPCSTITATAANGTIIQSVISSGTAQNFHAWVRRKTGTGTLSITVNNGSSWTDVTADVGEAGGAYKPVYIQGTAANPIVGFKIGTFGDAFEVAYANVIGSPHLPPPYPSAALDVGTSSDVFNIPFSAFPNASVMTTYADVWMTPSAISAAGGTSRIGFFGASTLKHYVKLAIVASTGVRLEHSWDNGTADDRLMGEVVSAGRIQIQFRMKPSDSAICYNGNAAFWSHLPPSIALSSLQATFSHSMWIRRLLTVPEDIDDDTDDLRTFKLDTTDANVNSSLLASSFVAKVVPDSTGILRVPIISVLYEKGDVCRFMVFWGQRATVGWNLEAPQRMMCRTGEFDRSTNKLTWLENERVLLQPTGWGGPSESSLSATTSNAFKIKHGKWRGRLISVYLQQDQAGGTPGYLNMYLWYSDDNGATWSPSVKIFDISDFGLSEGFVACGENGTMIQLDNGPYAGRIYAAFNMSNAQMGVMWTDDFMDDGDGTGATWSVTPANGGPGVGRVLNSGYALGTLTEPAIAIRPDNSLVLFFRNSGGGDVAFSVSTDYGQNFTVPALCAGDALAHNVNCGIEQDDPTGKLGKYGRLIIARSTLAGRIGHKIQSTTDAAMTLVTILRLFSAQRFVGYCPVKKAFVDDNIYLCPAEIQPTTTSNINTSIELAVFRC